MDQMKYLKELAVRYPNVAAASTEIINLQAILHLPKGTEHYVSDVHGEYEKFSHIIRNGSGAIRSRIEDEFGNTLTIKQKKNLASGRYVLKAQYSGTDTTGVEVHLFAEKTKDTNTQSSELFQAVIHPTKEWQESKINFSIEEGDTLTAGLTISAPPVYGMVRRFLLYKED